MVDEAAGLPVGFRRGPHAPREKAQIFDQESAACALECDGNGGGQVGRTHMDGWRGGVGSPRGKVWRRKPGNWQCAWRNLIPVTVAGESQRRLEGQTTTDYRIC
jgi:hypothetical protein